VHVPTKEKKKKEKKKERKKKKMTDAPARMHNCIADVLSACNLRAAVPH
jgi:hypothetical protein